MTAAAPLYFRSGGESLFGWLHLPPAGVRSDLGVVICKPFGYEAICAHNSLRAFGDACAAQGIATLRFDYSGTGDSSGGDTDADQIAQWCDDIAAAIEALQAGGAVRRVCLWGIRLGALLASRVAGDNPAVEALIALAPVVSGRRYLRELRVYQATAAEGEPAPQDGSLEVTGFRLSAASVATLSDARLPQATRRGLPHALVLDQRDMPNAADWTDALRATGTDVRYCSLPGFAEMMSTPHAAQVPGEMLAKSLEWLDGLGSAAQDGAPLPLPLPLPSPSTHSGAASMQICGDAGRLLNERAEFIDDNRQLFAIVTMAAEVGARAERGYGVVMLNGGATSHIGPNRMYVDLARSWASRGYVVLRLDLAGIGDSALIPGQTGNVVYPPGALDDIRAAIDYLRRQHGVDNITLAGLCAGAYHALKSATAGLPVHTVLLVNPLTFYWKQGSTLNDLQIAEVVRNPGVYSERIWAGKAWLKLLRGRVNLWRVVMVYVKRVWLAFDAAVRELTRSLHIRLPNDLGWDLRSVADRGTRIVFLFARGDAGADLLRIQGGSVVNSIGDRLRVHTIDGADHIFSQRAPRRQLLQLLSSELPR